MNKGKKNISCFGLYADEKKDKTKQQQKEAYVYEETVTYSSEITVITFWRELKSRQPPFDGYWAKKIDINSWSVIFNTLRNN